MSRPRKSHKTEHLEQVALFVWAEIAKNRWPELSLMYSIPNANIAMSGMSKLDAIRVIKYMKAEGLRPGFPDVCLPVARGGYHSMYVELKRKDGKVNDKQETWISRLREAGNHTVVAYGFDHVREEIEKYLEMK